MSIFCSFCFLGHNHSEVGELISLFGGHVLMPAGTVCCVRAAAQVSCSLVLASSGLVGFSNETFVFFTDPASGVSEF